MTEEKFEMLCTTARRHMSENRFAHTMRVYEECAYLCDHLGVSGAERETVLTAALLHDLAKQLPVREQETLCRRHHIDTEGCTEETLHGQSGAALARELLGSELVDDAVYHAISCHTTGDTDMTRADLILFIADYTEPGRKYENCRQIREYLHEKCEKIEKENTALCERLLRETAGRIIDCTIEYLKAENSRLDPRTLAARRTLD